MLKFFTFFLLILWIPLNARAQKSDYYWLTGRLGGTQIPLNDGWGAAVLDFNFPNKPKLIGKEEYEVNFDTTDGSICDSSGNLLFYTNGQKVYNKNHKIMENGNNIGFGGDDYGLRLPQGVVILPNPAKQNLYTVVAVESSFDAPVGLRLFSHTIEMSLNGGLGKVVEKRKLLLQDSLAWGKITAVKHANGRDWWFLIPHKTKDKYYVGLLSPSGIEIHSQDTEMPNFDGFGQCIFSPDGNKLIRTDNIFLDGPTYLRVYDFDRCSGQISNYRLDSLGSPGNVKFGAGCAVSPDSRYLYVFFTEIAVQYDLTAPDIFASKKIIGLQDGFISGNFGWKSYFLFSQLGPDGRIYIASWANVMHWHVLNFPKRDAEDCRFLQHALHFPVDLSYSIPNLPNYRLGPLDGSACDTLGIDNHPLANFRWEQEDSLSPLQVSFTDLSSYEPSAWHWSFGDGTFSTEIDPVHTYDSAGIYTACLVVSNQFSSDTFCQVLNFGVSGLETPLVAEGLSVQPNPANTSLTYALVWPQSAETRFELYDGYGKLAFTGILPAGEISETVSVEQIPSGMYFYTFSNGKSVLKKGKLVIVH